MLHRINLTRRRPQEVQFRVIEDQGNGLEERGGGAGETLEDDVGEEERRCLGELGCEDRWDACWVVHELGEGGDDA